MPAPKFMTIDGFTEWSGLGRTRIYYLLGGGDLKAIKVGRRTLIDMEHATEWLSSRPAADIRTVRRATP
ncbi:hypothetical protein [Rhodopila sp.]|uniref:hypothetical protein n=1 Tax=Rhodopila sp. TaxID=2480087 RepID=UPI003D0C4FA0